MPVCRLGDRRVDVPHGIGNVLDADTRGGQDRNERMSLFPRRPVLPDTGAVAQDDEVFSYILRPSRGASVIAEHDPEAANVVQLAELESLRRLVPAQRLEGRRHMPGHPDRAPGPLRLQLLQDKPPLPGLRIQQRLEALTYPDHACPEINVLPSEP